MCLGRTSRHTIGFREKVGIEYFRGVAEHLTAKDHKEISPILDPTRGIEYRGGQLRDQVNAALANRNLDAAQKTDIFAHSMGGLDSRWMLSPANPSRIQAPIRSLTTMSTPHLGSPIADLIDAPEKLAGLRGLGERELRSVSQHRVHDDCEAASQGDARLPHR
jgi:hypothetical protein